jgi:hypothetical protein
MTTTEPDLVRLKYFPEDRPRTADEIDRILRRNPLFAAVAGHVHDLTLEEFQAASRCWSGFHVPRSDWTVPEAEAEAVYSSALACWVAATRAGDPDAARAAALRAADARGALHALRDRLNELVWPWTDPGGTDHLY